MLSDVPITCSLLENERKDMEKGKMFAGHLRNRNIHNRIEDTKKYNFVVYMFSNPYPYNPKNLE